MKMRVILLLNQKYLENLKNNEVKEVISEIIKIIESDKTK